MSDKYEDMREDREVPKSISEQFPGEDRGAPDLRAPKRGNKKKKALIILGVIVGGLLSVFAILAFLIIQTGGHESSNVPDQTLAVPDADRNPLSEVQARLEAERRRREKKALREQQEQEAAERREERAQANADSVLGSSDAPPTAPPTKPAPRAPAQDSDELTPEQRKMQGDVLLTYGGDGSNKGGSSQRSSEIGDSLQGEKYEPGHAQVMQGEDMLLRRGTMIPCVIQNRIVSTYSSLSSCRVTQDVYSADGSTVLIERGSVAYGEQKVALLQGQARLFVTWNEIDTASGVRVRVDSLGVDPLGASGVNAWVDNHFWERFGGAIMLSFVDDSLSALASRLEESGGDSEVTFDSSTDNAGNMAELALENSIDIKPTGYVEQGTRMSIRVARDVDFSNVYNVERRP